MVNLAKTCGAVDNTKVVPISPPAHFDNRHPEDFTFSCLVSCPRFFDLHGTPSPPPQSLVMLIDYMHRRGRVGAVRSSRPRGRGGEHLLP